MIRILGLVLGLALTACPQPIPRPPPPPGPQDTFAGRMVTCYTPEARDATGAALGAVEACLAGGNVDACLVELVQAHAVDAVACAVRARGAEAATTVQEQPDAGLGEREIADAAREWIRSHNVGYL